MSTYSYRRVSVPRHPDALPTGQLITPFVQLDTFDLSNGEISIRFPSQESHDSFLHALLDMAKDNPIFLKTVYNIYNIPAHEQKYAKFLSKFIDEAQKNGDYDSSAALYALAQKTEAEEKKCEEEWKKAKADFHELVPPSFLEIFSGTTHETERLIALFEKLRDLKPTSVIPFVPLITILNQRFQTEDFKEILEKAKTIEPYLTYGIVRLYLMLTETTKKSSETQNTLGTYTHEAIATIKSLWPKDLFLSAFPLAEPSDTCVIDVSQIAAYFNDAMPKFLSQNYHDAIKTLLQSSELFVGNTRLYQYLSLAWLLSGDVQKGILLGVRAGQLPEWPTLGPLATLISQSLGRTYQKAKQTPITGLLSAFATLQQRNPHASPATPWLKAMETVLKNAVTVLSGEEANEGLPFVYFIFRHISQKFWTLPLHEYTDLYTHLGKMMTVVHPFYQLSEDLTEAEPFLKEHIHVCRTDQTFCLEIKPTISFGYPITEPRLAFYPNLKLDQESIRSLSTATLHILYTCLVDYIIGYAGREVPLDNLMTQTTMPDPHCLRKQWIVSQVRMALTNPEAYATGGQQLMAVLNDSDTDPDICEWVRYMVSRASHQTHKQTLPTEVTTALNSMLIEPSAKAWGLAIAASDRISNRHDTHQDIDLPNDSSSLPDLFEFALHYFGWRDGESFETWGIRLNEDSSLPPYDYQLALTMDTSEPNTPQSGVINIPINSKVSLPVLRIFRQALVDIHKQITDKNKHIQEGGDETGSNQPGWLTTLNQWISANQADWKQWISNGALPENVLAIQDQHLRSVIQKDPQKVQDILEKKHAHMKEVLELKKIYTTLSRCGTASTASFYAALLLENCSHNRQTHSHSVYVGTLKTAENVSRLLLDVAISQCFNGWLISRGPSAWRLSRTEAENLRQTLLPIGNTFHGPETHMTGNGPTQPHINAGVWVDRTELENSHIYFD